MTRTSNDRKAIAAIQIARKQLEPLGLDESAYRALVRRVSAAHGPEVDSSAKCTPAQRRAILDELQRQGARTPGAKKPANYPGKPHNFNSSAMPEMITKIEAQLADMGLSWAYADAIAKRQCGIPRVAWVREQDQLRGIIAALDVEQHKRGANEFIAEAMEKLNVSDAELAALTEKLPRNWRRNLRALRAVCDHFHARLDALAGSDEVGGSD
jgi:phage gp16-like protein